MSSETLPQISAGTEICSRADTSPGHQASRGGRRCCSSRTQQRCSTPRCRRDPACVSASDDETKAEAAWQVPADTPAAAVLDAYRQEIERANAVIAATPLDQPPAIWPTEIWPTWRLPDLRAVILHVITETACHAGHLDAARELIDGRQWMT